MKKMYGYHLWLYGNGIIFHPAATTLKVCLLYSHVFTATRQSKRSSLLTTQVLAVVRTCGYSFLHYFYSFASYLNFFCLLTCWKFTNVLSRFGKIVSSSEDWRLRVDTNGCESECMWLFNFQPQANLYIICVRRQSPVSEAYELFVAPSGSWFII